MATPVTKRFPGRLIKKRRKTPRGSRNSTGLVPLTDDRVKAYDRRYASRSSPGRRHEGLKTFYNEVDFPEFRKALSFSVDPKFMMLAAAFANPKVKECSFGELCRRCNLTLREVTTLWKDHQLQRGMMRMMNHMPEILEDTAIDAKTRTITCPTCSGEGKLIGQEFNKVKDPICDVCHGDGTIRLLGDKAARELVFESAGLKKGIGANTVNVNVGNIPSFEDSIKELDRIIDIPSESVESENVPDHETTVSA